MVTFCTLILMRKSAHLVSETLYRRIFADVIVYIFCSLAYDLPNRSSSRIYELNAKVERAD